jgi:hypothetical protein
MILAAFLLGVTGSLHCMGMCGPIALMANHSSKKFLANRLLYNAGRIITYAAFGLAIGSLGRIVRLDLYQSLLSLAGGLLVLTFLFIPGIQAFISPLFTRPMAVIKNSLGHQLRSGHSYATLFTGMLNGFLPCGLVYSALVVALVQPQVQESVLVMVMFGLGTVPALLVFAYSANAFQRLLPFSIQTLQKIAMVTVAALMIWRGIAIHFPEVFPGATTVCHTTSL